MGDTCRVLSVIPTPSIILVFFMMLVLLPVMFVIVSMFPVVQPSLFNDTARKGDCRNKKKYQPDYR